MPSIYLRAATLALALGGLAALPAAAQSVQHCTIEAQPSALSSPISYPVEGAPIGTALTPDLATTVSFRCPRSRQGYGIVISPTGFSAAGSRFNYPAFWDANTYGMGMRVAISPGGYTVSGADRTDPVSRRIIRYISSAGQTGSFVLTNRLVKLFERINVPDRSDRVDMGVIYQLYSYDNATRTMSPPLASISFNNGIPERPTCTVATRSVTVDLPVVASSSLRGDGVNAGRTPFTITLNCRRTDVPVYITMTDATTPGNRSDVLTLTPASTATGVGIRILNPASAPVFFGPDSAERGTVNQWRVGHSEPLMQIPLSAEYVTTGVVGPGTVGALATFTMSYQ